MTDHGLYVVGFSPNRRLVRIDYIPAHILENSPTVFEPREPMGPNAKRAGWRGFIYNLKKLSPDRHQAGSSRLICSWVIGVRRLNRGTIKESLEPGWRVRDMSN